MNSLKKNVLKITANVLKSTAANASNAASSGLYYQPKTPKKLQK